MQLARIVLPEPGEPVNKKPLFGGSLVKALNSLSFKIDVKSSA